MAPTASPVSHGVGRPATHLLRFQLRFGDPRLEEERVTIQGDHHQLKALHEAVKTYVQNLLNQSLERFKAMVCAPALPSLDTASSTHFNLDAPKPTTASSRQIFLQPGGGLAHEIFLGPLATKESGPIIHLSVLQLFDLATALDEYAADILALPVPGRRSASSSRAGLGIAAILLLAVGLTTAVVQFLNWKNPQKQIATTTAPQEASSKIPPQALQSSPLTQPSASIPPQTRQKSPLPKSKPIPSMSSSEKLPLMPPFASTVPSPSSSLPSVISPPTTTLKGVPPAITLPRTATALPNDQQLILPPAPPSSFMPRLTPPPSIVIPSPRQDRSAFIPGETAVPGVSSDRLRSKTSNQPTLSSNLPKLTPANPDLESVPSVAAPGAAPGTSSRAATQAYLPGTHLRNINPFKDGVSVPGTQKQPRSTTNTPNQPKSTVFDTIPQVAEARDYFKQRWTPPSSLTQTLEYNLVLDLDGTIQRIEPLGQAARSYVDRSGLPLVGEHFVSPITSGQTPTIRVVLSPDGKVQTFLESSK